MSIVIVRVFKRIDFSKVKLLKTGYNSKKNYFFTKHYLISYQINQYEETNPVDIVIFFYVNFSLKMRSKVNYIRIRRSEQSYAYITSDV